MQHCFIVRRFGDYGYRSTEIETNYSFSERCGMDDIS
jgi:hypothetical protein